MEDRDEKITIAQEDVLTDTVNNGEPAAESAENNGPDQLSHVMTSEELEAAIAADIESAKNDKGGRKTTARLSRREMKAAMSKKEIEEYYRKINRKIMTGFAAAIIVLSAGFIGINKYYSLFPYAIAMNNETVCYVDDKAAAREVVDELLNNKELEGADIKAIDADGKFSISRAEEREPGEILSVDDAVTCVRDASSEGSDDKDGDKAGFTVVSTRVEEHTFTPKTKYVKDDSMFAGQRTVLEKGKDGVKKYNVTYTTVNGEIADSEKELIEVLDEGKREKIACGTLGLPDGADWKTYEGDPVFNSGEDLVSTAEYYIGKVPYKWGGRNLNTGVSCLGLVKAIYAKYGINLPMSHPGMKKVGIGVSYSNAQPGDILCYKSHVAIYAGNGKMVDATSSHGVSLRKVDKGIVTVRRIPRS